MRYALLLANDESTVLTEDAQRRCVTSFVALIDEMLERGVVSDRGLRLQPTSTATSVRKRDGDVVIVDGPFAETKEQVAGLFIVDCKDLDEAIEFASRIPIAEFGTVEVRPVWEM
jgi:hypothetical protein